MLAVFRSKQTLIRALILALASLCCQGALAQTDDPANGETDPIKLFERGQDFHARNDLKKAIQLYDAAIKLKPEFPEAEFQRAMILVITNRQAEAIDGFKRAVALRPDWAIAYSKFGSQLAFFGSHDREAEPILRRALELNARDLAALTFLAVLRQHAGDLNDAVKLIRAATELPDATDSTWRRRAYIEHAAGDTKSAVTSLTRAIELEPSLAASYRRERAQFLLELNDRAGALLDLEASKATLTANTPASEITKVAQLYARAGRSDESLRLLDNLNENDRKLPEVIALRAELAADAGSSVEERAALEELLKRDPQNASLLARLGNAYRRVDPLKSQDYYYRAMQLDPKNAKYAVGYGAALVQGRRFEEAEKILRDVIAANADDYTAHANLALALFEMKRFAEALPEYEWLAAAKPEIAVTYFFIAIAHDNLREYQQAMDAYQQFLSRADPVNNKLEIEKVNLRLPTLRDQIRRGEGAKRKKP
ncbi:MAG: tetratricopeptide repeat protein [Pyrinomonadaceae bacterium]